MKITSVVPLLVNVSPKTNWFFLRVETDQGLEGFGEATLSRGWESVQLACLDRLRPHLLGKRIEEVLPILQVYPHSPGGLSANSVVSAVEQALVDVRAREAGVPVHALFGQPLRDSIRVYANLNRMTNDRSPAGFSLSARAKVAEGFTAVKIAPFDGVFWPDLDTADGKKRLALGIDRVLAVRDAIGPENDLLIDCHWRFDESTACALLRDLQQARLFWAECMVSERPVYHAALARVRAFAAERGVKLAGAEKQAGWLGIEAFVQGGLLDVVMPDIKYAGGYGEMLRISRNAAQAGIEISPHNPSGPVCTFASLHFCALIPNFLILEHQTEGSRYQDIIIGQHPRPVNGCFAVPKGPGIGVELRMDEIEKYPFRIPVAEAWADSRLG
ncbi:MAG: mandelate racemase/muconate lactonizing enzyme family protein [Betaproteobacteria bacterium]|nr:mandelate racemase/muconate lactonizing enzyme family protein [Betaproteobacteria bacterium]